MMRMLRRSDRTVMRMYGRDPLKMIQGLATNDIASAAVGHSVYTAFLTPKGRMVGDARVLRRANGDVLIEADRAAADNIAANFKKFVPPLFARFERLEAVALLEISGDNAARFCAEVTHLALLSNPFRPDALTVLINAEEVADTEAAAVAMGAVRSDFETLEVMRIEAGEPKWGAELNEAVIPLEAGLRNVAISETKGCYTGQEVIVRILHRGHVNRSLRGIMTGAVEVPAAGAELVRASDSKVVGTITSTCYSPALEQAIALAYVRREIEPPATVQLAEQDVHVVALPFTAAAQGAQR